MEHLYSLLLHPVRFHIPDWREKGASTVAQRTHPTHAGGRHATRCDSREGHATEDVHGNHLFIKGSDIRPAAPRV